jgi:hypothetical protein
MAKGHAGGLSRKECESRGTLLEFLERYPDEEPCERRCAQDCSGDSWRQLSLQYSGNECVLI